MQRIHIRHKLIYLVLLVLLAAAACTPAAPSLQVDADEIVQQVLAQIESQQAQQGEIVPAVYAPTPIAAAQEVETLQDTLIGLYQRANPAVVYIIVSSNVSGSGFVYDEKGAIVTNYHVASAGKSYEVVFANGERQRATLVGADADSDLAVLRVDKLPGDVLQRVGEHPTRSTCVAGKPSRHESR